MSLLTRLGLRTETVEYDPLSDAHDVTSFALHGFHSVIDDLSYANDKFNEVIDHSAARVLHHKNRITSARTRQTENNAVIAKVREFLGQPAEGTNAGNEAP